MLQLTYPGVYTQELPSGVRTIAGAPTSVALFVGPTRSGIDGRPILCLNFGDFERNFGGLSATSSLSHSVLHFFANGGGQAYVIRVPVSGAVAAKSGLQRDGAATASITLTALGSGAAGNSIFVAVDPFEIGAKPFTSSADNKRFTLTVTDALTGRVERFANLTTAAGNARTADAVVNDRDTGSRLVSLRLDGLDAPGPQATGSIYRITTAPTAGTFSDDVKLSLSVDRRKADGNTDPAISIANLAVTVFPKNAVRPVSPLELVTRLVTALNDALRAQPDADVRKLGGATVEGAVFEGGTLMRLQLSPPAGAVGTDRFHDATVTIAAPASGTSFLTTYGIDHAGLPANPSRYQLGAAYVSSQVTGQVAGTDGAAHGQPDSVVFKTAVSDLDTPDPFFNLLCLPDIVRPSTADPKVPQHANLAAVYAEAARVCGNKFAFLVVDPPPDAVDVGSAAAWKSTKIGFASSHAGAWFPNVRVDNPLEAGAIMSHPPSGTIAGVIARTDSRVGVWQSPAGTDATLAGVYGPSVELSDEEQGLLNPIAVNAIRRFPIYQTVAFGSRTVDGANALGSEWKYIPVRRTASYILRSLSEGLRWAVHKPNGEDLWTQLRVSCTAFMQGLFRQGAFKGTSPRQAYFVACDSSTTTQDDIDQGIVNIVIGFSPLKPAEFVVITLRQIVQPAA